MSTTRDLMIQRLREESPIRPSTYVHAVMAETGLSRSAVREHLRYLVDWGHAGLDWKGNLVLVLDPHSGHIEIAPRATERKFEGTLNSSDRRAVSRDLGGS